MLRTKIFEYLSLKQAIDRSLLKYTNQFVRKNRCQCLSTTNFVRNLKEQTLTSHQQINVDETEKEFVVRIKSDPDRFGPPQEEEIFDEGDIQEEKYITEHPLPSQKLRTKQYADIIKDLIGKRKIKEAIDVMEIKMIKEDRVKPESYIYNLLLGACGRVGYTKKAFMLYNDMKRRGLAVSGGTYTALFNSCSNSPWPLTDGLTRATHLRDIMVEKGYEPNDTNYNAMIKAFGRCGDLPTAFSLVDEMISKNFPIKDDTINFLLQACITDHEAGFRRALLVWRKLVEKNIKPSLYTYNLFLRCIRDCGLGDVDATHDVINKLISNNGKNHLENYEVKLLASSKDVQGKPADQDFGEIEHSTKAPLERSNHGTNLGFGRPNLMADVPHLGNIISVAEVQKAEDRLLLVGGCSGFLENVKQHGCCPDIKTFTQLLDCIPSTLAAESEILLAMKKLKVRPDVDFFNMLIKKRSMRFDYESAKEVLSMIDKQGYKPNLITYGVLSLGCKTAEESQQLLEIMKYGGYSLNAEILGAMLNQACHHQDFGYVFKVMELCIQENVQPNKKFMERLAEFKGRCQELSKTNNKFYKKHGKVWEIFKARYKGWRGEITVDEAEDAHPWQQYRQTNPAEVKHRIKDSARFKARHLSVFKVKTSTKHRY